MKPPKFISIGIESDDGIISGTKLDISDFGEPTNLETLVISIESIIRQVIINGWVLEKTGNISCVYCSTASDDLSQSEHPCKCRST